VEVYPVDEATIRKWPWFLLTMLGRKVLAVQRIARLFTPKFLETGVSRPDRGWMEYKPKLRLSTYSSMSFLDAVRIGLPLQMPALAMAMVGSPTSFRMWAAIDCNSSKSVRSHL
jgi:hypothetical protein